MPVSDKNLARFKRAVKQLETVIHECKTECSRDEQSPFAYLDGNDNLHLLTGEHGIGEAGVDETILISERLTAQCGDW